MEHLSYKKWPRKLGLFSLEKRELRGILYQVSSEGRVLKGQTQALFQWCQYKTRGWNTGESCLNIRKQFLLWGWPSSGTGWPERLWCLSLESFKTHFLNSQWHFFLKLLQCRKLTRGVHRQGETQRMWFWVTGFMWPFLEQRGWTTSWSPFQPQVSSDFWLKKTQHNWDTKDILYLFWNKSASCVNLKLLGL